MTEEKWVFLPELLPVAGRWMPQAEWDAVKAKDGIPVTLSERGQTWTASAVVAEGKVTTRVHVSAPTRAQVIHDVETRLLELLHG